MFPPHDLAPREGVNTYWKYALPPGEVDYSRTSWIDHTLLHGSSQVQAVEVGLSTGSFWNTVSDHRPLDLTVTSPWYDIGATPQAASTLPPSIALVDLVSTTEPEYVAEFYKLLGVSLAGLPRTPTNDHQLSGDSLRTIATASYASIQKKPLTRLCK